MNNIWRNRAEGVGRWLAGHAPTIASLAMVIAIAYVLACLTWAVVPQPSTPFAVATPTTASTVNHDKANAAMQAMKVASLHLFGQAQSSGKGRVANAPETTLNLTLHGIIAANDTEHSRALIAVGSGKKGKGKPYKVGDDVPGGASVHAIYPDRVILARNGHLETLKLRQDGDDSGQIVAVRQAPSSPPSSGPLEPGMPNEPRPGRMPAGHPVPDTDGMIRAIPIHKSGTLRGYRILAGTDTVRFVNDGLTAGDIVESVNGKKVTDPSDLTIIAHRLNNGKPVKMTVIRGGQAQQIVVTPKK